MTIFGEIMKGGAEGLLKGVGSLAKDIRVAITGKETLNAQQITDLQMKALALEEAVLEADTKIAEGQIAVNKSDAESGSFFRGGWRPFVGWVCATGLLYTFLLRPLIPWIIIVTGLENVPPLPPVDMQTLMTLLLGMLGLGGFRTYEKVKGLK
jgi:hypothetical protein